MSSAYINVHHMLNISLSIGSCKSLVSEPNPLRPL